MEMTLDRGSGDELVADFERAIEDFGHSIVRQSDAQSDRHEELPVVAPDANNASRFRGRLSFLVGWWHVVLPNCVEHIGRWTKRQRAVGNSSDVLAMRSGKRDRRRHARPEFFVRIRNVDDGEVGGDGRRGRLIG